MVHPRLFNDVALTVAEAAEQLGLSLELVPPPATKRGVVMGAHQNAIDARDGVLVVDDVLRPARRQR